MNFEDIVALNAQGQKSNPIKRLLAMGAADPDILEFVSDKMEQADSPLAAAFFQLPFPISVSGDECTATGESAKARVSLKFRPITINCDRLGQVQVVQGWGEGWAATQVIATAPYWGERAKFYSVYEACISGAAFRDRVIVPLGRSRIWAHAMTATAFEAHVMGRMRRDAKAAMRDFLPAYALATRQKLPELPSLYSMFVMPHPGRVSVDSDIRPLAAGVFSSAKVSRRGVDQATLASWMKIRFRHIREFERELLTLQAIADAGQPWLALIGAISLIERKLQSHSTDAKPPGKGAFDWLVREHLAPIFSLSLRRRLLVANAVRNKLVHKLSDRGTVSIEMPPDGVLWGTRERTEVDIAVAAEQLLKDAFEVYRLLNAHGRPQADIGFDG